MIGLTNEKDLHASLKQHYAAGGGQVEVEVDGFVIDVVRGDELVEIQTRSFSHLKRKLRQLIEDHTVLLVHPIPVEKWIVKLHADGRTTRRKSPKRGRVEQVCDELVSLPDLLGHSNFRLEVALTLEDEVRRHEAGKVWRRKGWVIVERRLISISDVHRFDEPRDLLALLPDGLEAPFTTADLARAAGLGRPLAQRLAYCLRHLEVIQVVGKRGNALEYTCPSLPRKPG